MNFDKLHSIILREEKDPIAEAEDWYEWVNWNDTDITLEEYQQLKDKFNLVSDHIIKNKIAKLYDEQNTVYLEFFPEHQTFDVWAKDDEDVEETVMRLPESEALELLGIEEDDVWMGHWECTIKDAQEFPGMVYHYTTPEKWEEIQEHGGLIPSYGSGLTNRNASGVFTTCDPEELEVGTYGDVRLDIDLARFKTENNLPKLEINPEPEVLEVELHRNLLSKFGIDSREEVSSDMSPYTMIVNHFIPVEYITTSYEE